MNKTQKISVFNHSNNWHHNNNRYFQLETTTDENTQKKFDDTLSADVVLIVDDILTDLEVLSECLQSRGFTVSIASDGVFSCLEWMVLKFVKNSRLIQRLKIFP